jgi:hypothetical protein
MAWPRSLDAEDNELSQLLFDESMAHVFTLNSIG